MEKVTIVMIKEKELKKGMNFAAGIILAYFLFSLYFMNHFYFHTVINGVEVSLKGHTSVDSLFQTNLNNYELVLIGRNGIYEIIAGQEVGLYYREKNSISGVYRHQNPFFWIVSLIKKENYYVSDLYGYDYEKLKSRIEALECLRHNVIKPENAGFYYANNAYYVKEEESGNTIDQKVLMERLIYSLLRGKHKLDLEDENCYEIPKYTKDSPKTKKTEALLNQYISTQIIYQFGDKKEILDGTQIHQWLDVNEKLDIIIEHTDILNYIKSLCKQYDSIGRTRSFQTSTGKIIEVRGGIYGWRINQEEEKKKITEDIMKGKIIEREPVYQQRAISREGNEIGDTYVEINLSMQMLWFYSGGALLAKGPVVTGNPSKGNATVTGTYMINYKMKNATLSGPGYEAGVSFWMPFYGNIGIHDAPWKYSFGGEIYKTRGTHGCVNAPYYLAKVIYENIEEGIPVICYKEE